MITETILDELYDNIVNAANSGPYTKTAVSLVTPNFNLTDNPQDATYLVVENYHSVTIIRLDINGVPDAVLESEL